MLQLPRTRQAPGIARRWLAKSFGSEVDDLTQQTAKLLVSELVTNAVVHGRGRIELHAQLDGDRLFVEVSDEGPGFRSMRRGRDPDPAGGHGLHIVEEEASRWGIREGRADVWFELPRHAADPDRRMHGPIPDAQRDTRGKRHSVASSADSLVPSARPDRSGASPGRRLGRPERAALYGWVADTLDRSADLVELYAKREYRREDQQVLHGELELAKRAREAAMRGRALCSLLP